MPHDTNSSARLLKRLAVDMHGHPDAAQALTSIIAGAVSDVDDPLTVLLASKRSDPQTATAGQDMVHATL